MSQKPEKIHVHIKYKDVTQEFSAEPQEAWLLLNQFFKGMLPSFEIAQKLWLNIDVAQLSKDLNGIVAFSVDGVSLLVPKNKLTDNEALLVWLAAYYLGNKVGLVNSDSLSKDELQSKLGKSGKITSTRLGELVKTELVAKEANDRFRVTTFGVTQTQKDVIPKIRAKTST
ncbi:MAG: hypothetical protein M1490_04290 [Candidatus Bathyarchaeota archaeon]|nr:hypothetical protein [Candidatus Bathyarchaeota archaeon]